jgi:hypothetical protein
MLSLADVSFGAVWCPHSYAPYLSTWPCLARSKVSSGHFQEREREREHGNFSLAGARTYANLQKRAAGRRMSGGSVQRAIQQDDKDRDEGGSGDGHDRIH